MPPDHREQAVCRLCDFVFYLNPKVVAGTIPEQDGRVLLTRRSINPGHGLWTFPGGFVDFGESVTDAAVRETLEETGLAVDLTGLHNVYSYPGSPVIVVYRARVTGGTITSCAENDRLEWTRPPTSRGTRWRSIRRARRCASGSGPRPHAARLISPTRPTLPVRSGASARH